MAQTVKLTKEQIKASNESRKNRSKLKAQAESAAQANKIRTEASGANPAGREVVASSAHETWASQAAVAKNKSLRFGSNMRHYDVKRRVELPIYPGSFKCEFCEEEFQHIACDTLQFLSTDNEKSYRRHLIEDHTPEAPVAPADAVHVKVGDVVTADKLAKPSDRKPQWEQGSPNDEPTPELDAAKAEKKPARKKTPKPKAEEVKAGDKED